MLEKVQKLFFGYYQVGVLRDKINGIEKLS